MTASDVATATALIATLGILFETVELIGARHQICRFLDMKVIRLFLRYNHQIKAAGILRQPDTLKLFLILRAAAAVATVYFLALQMPLAVVSTVVVVVITYLKDFRMPLGATGADRMQRFIWICLFLFALAPSPIAQTAALGFIAFQGLYSYFMAGVNKLKVPSWRDGTAVGQVVATEAYGITYTMKLSQGWVFTFLTYSTLVFEIAGPFLVLLGPEATLVFLGMAFFFHASVAVVSGLTIFIFAFSATYPAIYWIVVQAQSWL